MEQETLEEIFDIIDDEKYRYSTEESEFWTHYKIGVIDGLQYKQERMYSEEEVLELLLNCPGPYLTDKEIKEWFNKFKKKKYYGRLHLFGSVL
jgi:hypothetical protein